MDVSCFNPHDEAAGLKTGTEIEKIDHSAKRSSVNAAICCEVGNAHLDLTTNEKDLVWQKKYQPHGWYFSACRKAVCPKESRQAAKFGRSIP